MNYYLLGVVVGIVFALAVFFISCENFGHLILFASLTTPLKNVVIPSFLIVLLLLSAIRSSYLVSLCNVCLPHLLQYFNNSNRPVAFLRLRTVV